jgi:hypothetical protein
MAEEEPLLSKEKFGEIYNATIEFEKWLKNRVAEIIHSNDFKLVKEFIGRIENLRKQRERLFGK